MPTTALPLPSAIFLQKKQKHTEKERKRIQERVCSEEQGAAGLFNGVVEEKVGSFQLKIVDRKINGFGQYHYV